MRRALSADTTLVAVGHLVPKTAEGVNLDQTFSHTFLDDQVSPRADTATVTVLKSFIERYISRPRVVKTGKVEFRRQDRCQTCLG